MADLAESRHTQILGSCNMDRIHFFLINDFTGAVIKNVNAIDKLVQKIN